MAAPPSGEQFEIRSGSQVATIVEVGGGIREYAVGDRPVFNPYSVDEICDGAHGAPLIPWPNRLADGRYRFDGVDHQVPLTEPEKHNAIHGFLRWRSWRAQEHHADRVVMVARLHPMPGYPFTLDVEIAYALDAGGLTVTTIATNAGDRACPYAAGYHPYLSPGTGTIDDCVLTLDAATRIDTDAERQLPTGSEPVTGTVFDFRTARRLGDQQIDYAFTDLARDHDGKAWASLRSPDGARAELWVDESYPLLELYTADTLGPERRRRGLGCEPMTCPPNGFQDESAVIRLEPGQSHQGAWGARLS